MLGYYHQQRLPSPRRSAARQAPDSETLERFLGRLPLMFKVVILSPHGYFGQTNVLGMPDTGGQVGGWVGGGCTEGRCRRCLGRVLSCVRSCSL